MSGYTVPEAEWLVVSKMEDLVNDVLFNYIRSRGENPYDFTIKLTHDRYKHTWEMFLIKNKPAVFEDKDIPYFIPKPGFERVASLTVSCDRSETLKDIACWMYRNYINDHTQKHHPIGGDWSDYDALSDN
jgi:hypothetical protein